MKEILDFFENALVDGVYVGIEILYESLILFIIRSCKNGIRNKEKKVYELVF